MLQFVLASAMVYQKQKGGVMEMLFIDWIVIALAIFFMCWLCWSVALVLLWGSWCVRWAISRAMGWLADPEEDL
jgi:hypothetical protein